MVCPPSFPSDVPRSGAPFPPRGPAGRFPRFTGPTGRSDSLPLVPSRSVPRRATVPPCAPPFAPIGVQRARRGPGASSTGAPSGLRAEDDRASQVPGEPYCAHALLFDPGGTSTPGHRGVSVRPSAVSTASAPTTRLLSGLNHTAHARAVDASPPRVTPGCARLASGCWPALPGGTGYPLGSTQGFRALYISSPLPRFRLAHRNASLAAGRLRSDERYARQDSNLRPLGPQPTGRSSTPMSGVHRVHAVRI